MSEVAFIDTTGSFSPARLRDVILSRIEHHSPKTKYQQTGYMYEPIPQPAVVPPQEALLRAVSMLDRVRIMRVFDFVGLVEAVAEVGDLWERQSQVIEREQLRQATARRIEIADSETEEVEEDNRRKPHVNMESLADMTEHITVVSGIGMIITDTVTNVVSSIMTRNQTQGKPSISPQFFKAPRVLSVPLLKCMLMPYRSSTSSKFPKVYSSSDYAAPYLCAVDQLSGGPESVQQSKLSKSV